MEIWPLKVTIAVPIAGELLPSAKSFPPEAVMGVVYPDEEEEPFIERFAAWAPDVVHPVGNEDPEVPKFCEYSVVCAQLVALPKTSSIAAIATRAKEF